MEINRDNLLNELYEFALDGGGMVVGKPGIGKSYLLQQLQNRLLENEIVCVIVKIDNAFDSSDKAIEAELLLDTNWIETLNDVELANDQKSILIFDAFDAARDEDKRSGFLTQIKKAKSALRDKWNIIVSVRTYDASKSKDLERIFLKTNGELVSSRKKYIQELSDQEVEQAFCTNHQFRELYAQSSQELRKVLHVPFFLKILEDIIKNSSVDELEIIKNYRSEIQLLEAYWQRKIIDTIKHLTKEKFLLSFTRLLVENKSLSYPKSELLLSLDHNDVEVFDYLRSENIIDEVSINNSRIAFSHNILFDYAISRYCLSEDYSELLDFITTDASRPFFFRPSFVYFFTTLWYGNKKAFWNIYDNLATSAQKEIRLFVRLIVNGTIASEFNSVKELHPILVKNGTDLGNEYICNLLQSIRFIRTRTAFKDIQLLKSLSENLQIRYLFEFAFLLDRAISDSDGENYQSCGESARNLLTFVIQHRSTNQKTYLDRIGATRGVELVAKTYGTDIEKSDIVLRGVFEIIKEPGFEISYFTHLAEDIKYILKIDPDFVRDVYFLIFDYTEISEEKTNIGAGVVMSLISNRRQDFEMCYYRLQKFFPEFLSFAPIIATETGIAIVNKHLIINKVKVDAKDVIEFDYGDIKCILLSDYSSIWAENRSGSYYESIAQSVIDYVEQLLLQNDILKVKEILRVYISKSQVGYLWKLLFRLAAKYPEKLFEDIYPLILIPQLFSASETIFEIKEFIRNTGDMLTDHQVLEIEEMIFITYPSGYDYAVQGALSMLPIDRLQTERAKEFMSKNKVVSNEPEFKISTSVTPYTNDEWLSDRGVDLADNKNRTLADNINKLEGFNRTFLNDNPYFPEQQDFMELAIEVFSEIADDPKLPTDLSYSALNAISKTAAVFAANLKDVPEDEFIMIKRIIVFAYSYESPYEDGQSENSPSRGYSPTPRIEAASALIPIYVHSEDEIFLNMIQSAMSHINGVVRFNVIRKLPLLFNKFYDKYQEFLFERLSKEQDAFVYASLLNSIYFKKDRVIEDGQRTIQLINQRNELFISRNEFVEAYAELLLWFISNHDMPEASNTLKEAYKYPEFCKVIIFKLFKTIQIDIPREKFLENFQGYKTKIDIVKYYINNTKDDLVIDGDNLDLEVSGNKNAIELFDEVIMRIYFSLEQKQSTNSMENDNRRDLYFLIKEVFESIIEVSANITTKGLIIGHTAHYFIQCLNSVLYFDPKDILKMVANITKYSVQAGYTFDSFAIKEIVNLTEQLLADHRYLLLEDDCFKDLLSILDIYTNSGWVDALELLWKLDEIFK